MEMTMMNGFGFYELSQEEQNSVNGGEFPWGEVATAVISVAGKHPVITGIVVGAAAAYACWEVGQAVGEDLGKFIYNVTH